MARRIAFLWICLGLFCAGIAAAQAPKLTETTWATWEAEASMARQVIDAGAASAEALEHLRLQLENQRDAAEDVAKIASDDIANIQAELDALGPPPEDGLIEDPTAAALRGDIDARLSEARAKQGRAQRTATKARVLLTDLQKLAQRNFIERLEKLSPSPILPSTWVAAGEASTQLAGRLAREIRRNVSSSGMRRMVGAQAPLAILTLVTGLFVMFVLRGTALRTLTRGAHGASQRRSRLMLGIGLTAARVLLTGLAAGLIMYGVGTLGVLGTVGDTILRSFGQGVAMVILAYAVAAGLFSPEAAGLRLFTLTDAQARGAFVAAMGLAFVLALDRTLVTALDTLNAPAGAWSTLTFVTVLLGSVALYRLTVRLGIAPTEPTETSLALQAYRVLRRAVLAVCFATPVLALIGFSFAARYIFTQTALSVAVIGGAYLVFAVIREVVDVFLAQNKERGDRFRLIPVLVGFILFCITVPVLALIWGASILDLRAAYTIAAGGLVLGDVAISPIDFVTFAIVFSAGYILTRAAQRVMSVSVLPRTSMSAGGASALVSGLGYIGIFLTAIAAVSATGIDLSNLAIVFGALSVGIGFGLQNIVNNFVSGVILLVERPIKVGDWIDVGGQSGYVKKVNVRSTEIETFDRASYIVPNSDLIAAPVLNWTHSNKVGRVRCKVGVAYGTDARKVERILLDIGADHPMVIRNPDPVVYFMGFGADSLDFELRVYLSDVNWMLSVLSDINFRVNERFAEEGIEIPFAQRDLHIKNPEALMEIVDRRAEPGGGAASTD